MQLRATTLQMLLHRLKANAKSLRDFLAVQAVLVVKVNRIALRPSQPFETITQRADLLVKRVTAQPLHGGHAVTDPAQ